MFQFRRLLSRYQPFIAPIGFILACFFVGFLVIFPAIQKTIQQFEDISVLKDQVDLLQQKVQVLNNLDEASLQQNVELTNSAVPIDKSLPTLLSTMEGVSDKTGVTLKSLSVDSPGSIATQTAKPQVQSTEEKKIGAYTLPFSVTLSGTFDQIQTFLSVSNKIRRIVRAKSFTLSFSETQLTTQIAFDTFYAPLVTKGDTEQLTQLQNKDFDLLAKIEEYPNMSMIGENIPVTPGTTGKPNPFSL